MKKILSMATLTLVAGLFGPPALAATVLVKFDGGVGEHPVAGIGADGLPVRNDVHGVPGGGRVWVIESLRARVTTDGQIFARGRGLVLGATDAIGTAGGVTTVAATLFCGAQAFNSPAVALTSTGDFLINGPLDALPPNPCTTPVLLIRNAPGGVPGAWFAAGVPKP